MSDFVTKLTLSEPRQDRECALTVGKQIPYQQIWLHNEASQTKVGECSETAGYHWSLLQPWYEKIQKN